ncbi:MAG: Gfo/Idh/MocA family oxidoreductase [Ignavibacteria bacterium]|nr:MAG: Gfo/Idh/MocA family oxidoreductase [Ignavibacteria bacterium]
MNKVKVAIIGLGGVAQLVHLPNLLKIKSVILQSVAEIKTNRLNAIAEKFNIPERYKDYRELLAKSDVDAVIVTTPTALHKEIAIDCLNAKKELLVEKPIARTFKEAAAILKAAKKNNKKLMVGMNLRFRPDTLLLKSLIQSKEIGDPFYARAVWIRRQSSEEKWFMKREEAGGGVILDLGISLLDLSLWLMGYPNVKSVQTQNFYQSRKTLEDTSISFIRCDNSKLINIETSWALPVEKDLFQLSVYGSNGSVTSTPLHLYKKVENQIVDLKPTLSESPSHLFKKAYLNELKSFIGAVRGLNPVFSSGEQAVERLRVIEAMYKSADTNQEVKIS